MNSLVSTSLSEMSDAELHHAFQRLFHERRLRLEHASRADLIEELSLYQELDQALQYHMNLLASDVYEGKHPKHWLWKSHKQFVLDRVEPGERILDVGCGASAYLLWMAEKGCKVTGCDINPDRIEQAKTILSHENLSFEVRDVTTDLPAELYDTVICSHVIEHIDDPIPLLRALRDNGRKLIVCVPPIDSRWQKVMFRDLGLRWKDDEDHRREYTPDLLRGQVEAAGWRVVEMHAGIDIKCVAVPDVGSDQ